jgi:hypothetical protein
MAPLAIVWIIKIHNIKRKKIEEKKKEQPYVEYFLHACPEMYAHSSSIFSNFEGLYFVYAGFYELCWPWLVKQGYCVENNYRI